jgi:hypothetical protein
MRESAGGLGMAGTLQTPTNPGEEKIFFFLLTGGECWLMMAGMKHPNNNGRGHRIAGMIGEILFVILLLALGVLILAL